MDHKTERNARLYEIFLALITGYEEGDFSGFFPYLSEDCRYTSMWVMEPMLGRERIVRHLTRKGEAVRRSGSFPRCTIVRLVGNVNTVSCDAVHVNGGKARPGCVGLWYEDGKYALLMEQTIDGRTNGILIDLSLDEQGMVKKFDLCEPALFAFEPVPPASR